MQYWVFKFSVPLEESRWHRGCEKFYTLPFSNFLPSQHSIYKVHSMLGTPKCFAGTRFSAIGEVLRELQLMGRSPPVFRGLPFHVHVPKGAGIKNMFLPRFLRDACRFYRFFPRPPLPWVCLRALGVDLTSFVSGFTHFSSFQNKVPFYQCTI